MIYPQLEKLNLKNPKILHPPLQIAINDDDNDKLHGKNAKFEIAIVNPSSKFAINDDKDDKPQAENAE